nr:immunoglobulin heavy chain junction region [Mus musculus]
CASYDYDGGYYAMDYW